jgi:glycyl-tRNA synthetase (class II)
MVYYISFFAVLENKKEFKNVISHAKNMVFIFPSSEIYDG